MINVAVGDDALMIAQKIADEIDLDPQVAAAAYNHEPGFSNADGLVVIDGLLTADPDNVSFSKLKTNVTGIDVSRQALRFHPLDFREVGDYDAIEQHSIGINYADSDVTNIEVFAVPQGTFGQDARAYAWSYFHRNRLPGLFNTIFILESALDDDDSTDSLTLGHELGHVLFAGRFLEMGNKVNHSAIGENLMFDGTSDEQWDGTKRLHSDQISDARTDSGPQSPNPVLKTN